MFKFQFKNQYKSTIFILSLTIILATLFYYGILFSPEISKASSLVPLNGWLWSSTIGWISLNCQDAGNCAYNYEVDINADTGEFFGYGWSNNIGWLSFNPEGPYPEAPQNFAKIDFSTGTVSGWIRACAVFQSGCSGALHPDYKLGGWSGWLKLVDAKFENNKLTGWGWDNLIVGWLNFYNAYVLPYCSNFSANPSSIIPPQTSTLSWQCYFSDSCSIDQGIGQICSGSECQNDFVEVLPSQTTDFTLTCQNSNGSKNYSVTVDVGGPGGSTSGGSTSGGSTSGGSTNAPRVQETIPR